MRIPVATVILLAVLSACGSATSGSPVAGGAPSSSSAAPETSTSTPTSTSSSGGGVGKACDFTTDPNAEVPAGKNVGLPPAKATDKPASVVLSLNSGEVTVTLTVQGAPCTTRSFAYLAGKQFFDGTRCHRLTTGEGLKVLQCGDPQGTGTGGPGYTVPDENPTTLKPGSDPQTVIYPRGTVAMANTGQPHSGGSQFFIV